MKKKKAIAPVILIIAMIMVNLLMCTSALAADAVTVNIPVYKVIEGDTPSEDETFSFELESLNDEPMPAGSASGIRTVSISGDGSTVFGQITYTEPGDYFYEISEAQGENDKYTYDDTVYSLTVQVTWADETYGDLQAVMYLTEKGGTEKQENAVFTNVYSCPEVTIDPPVQKRISGDTPYTDSTFTFYLKADDLSYPMPSGSANGVITLSITGAGAEDFGYITYTEAGVYTYTVYERNSGINGYDYDSVVYTMTVTVTEEDGELIADREIVDDDGYAASSLTFTNHYTLPESPKTGDDSLVVAYLIILAMAAFGVIISLVIKRIQDRKNEEKQC